MALRLSTGLRQALLTTGDFAAELDLGFLYIYTGTQPANADLAASGTLLATIANADGSTGITFEAPVLGVMPKTAGETWSGAAVAGGTAGWFRHHELDTNKATTETTAAASSAASSAGASRYDGAVAVSGAELDMSNTTVVNLAVQTITTFSVTLPAN